MNTKMIFLFIFGIGLLTSCINAENDLSQETTINGAWNLINVSGGLASINQDYSKEEIKWTFNQTDSTLSVQNNIGNNNSFMLPSGTYRYNIEQNRNSQILLVDKPDYRMIIPNLEGDLIISDDLNDGFTAKFKR